MTTKTIKLCLVTCISVILLFLITACNNESVQYYGTGDIVDTGFDTTMVLNSADFSNNKLKASFTLKNVGTENQSYNLWMSLQARDGNNEQVLLS